MGPTSTPPPPPSGPPDFRLLFATSFSPACERAGRAVAQLAEACRVDLTLAHVVPPGARNPQLHQRLEQVLQEHEVGRRCRRILVESVEPASAVMELCERDRFDAVVAPASGRWSLSPDIGTSFRGQLLQRCRVPLWTAGKSLSGASFDGPIRTVACLLDVTSSDGTWLQAADAFARRVGAALRLLALVPPVDEGLLTHVLNAHAPLTTAGAVERVRRLSRGCAPAGIDVAVGDGVRDVNRQLERCGADLLFVSREWSLRGLDRFRCPVVCVDTDSIGPVPWSFQEVVACRIPILTFDRDAVAGA